MRREGREEGERERGERKEDGELEGRALEGHFIFFSLQNSRDYCFSCFKKGEIDGEVGGLVGVVWDWWAC